MSTPEQPESTPAEEEASPERREDEDALRGPGHKDPERAREPEE